MKVPNKRLNIKKYLNPLVLNFLQVTNNWSTTSSFRQTLATSPQPPSTNPSGSGTEKPENFWQLFEGTFRPCTSWPGLPTAGSSCPARLIRRSSCGRWRSKRWRWICRDMGMRCTRWIGRRTDREWCLEAKIKFSDCGENNLLFDK